MTTSRRQAGYLVVLLLVFGAVFFTIFTAFMGFTITGKKVSNAKLNSEQSLQIAEAGLAYYKWFLSHNPDNITNATTTPGPYVIAYSDPEGSAIGEYSLAVDGNLACGAVTSIDITSTANTYAEPSIKRTVFARYARPNVAEYSHIVNANVWAGPDRQIYGPYHSNGFVRMDGTNNSKVTSGQTSGQCQDIDVCTSSVPPFASNTTVVNGVFGAGPRPDLWSSPTPPISFTGVTVDLSNIQTKATTGGGKYFANSGGGGYYVVFNSNGTYTVSQIKQSKAQGNAYGHAKNFLNSSKLIGTYSVPASCSVIFFEDDIWIEGVVSGKVTIAAADLDTAGVDPTITIIGNLTYANTDSGLLAIAEKDVLIGLDVPDDMFISGIFIAQTGWFGRKHFSTYYSNSATTVNISNSLSQDIYKNSLTTTGTVVSNGRVGTKWTCSGVYCSGFNYRYDYYDRGLAIDPPPLTPKTSDNYQFIEWREME